VVEGGAEQPPDHQHVVERAPTTGSDDDDGVGRPVRLFGGRRGGAQLDDIVAGQPNERGRAVGDDVGLAPT
jgi:hypothetical protein